MLETQSYWCLATKLLLLAGYIYFYVSRDVDGQLISNGSLVARSLFCVGDFYSFWQAGLQLGATTLENEHQAKQWTAN